MSNRAIFMYIPCPTKHVGEELARHLLQERMIACAQLFPAESFYLWNNAIAHDQECILLLKTTPEYAHLVEQEIEMLHPYDIPCIARFEVTCNSTYMQWMTQSINGKLCNSNSSPS